MLNPNMDDDERAVTVLLEAVSFVTTALRARQRRDALLAVADPTLAALATRVVAAFGFKIYSVASGAGGRADGGRAAVRPDRAGSRN